MSLLFDIQEYTGPAPERQRKRLAGMRRTRSEEQGRLFENDRRINSLGQARYLIGEFFEEWAADITRGERLETTTDADICPDLLLPSGYYAECKGSGCNNQIILYEDRCKKYDEFIAEGNKVVYIVFNHDVKVEEMTWFADLELLRKRCKSITYIDAEELHPYVYTQPSRVVNGSHENPKYHSGWTIQVSTLVELSSAEKNPQKSFLTFKTNKFA